MTSSGTSVHGTRADAAQSLRNTMALSSVSMRKALSEQGGGERLLGAPNKVRDPLLLKGESPYGSVTE